MSLYYNNNKLNFGNITPEMIDTLLSSDTISKYITQNDLNRIVKFLPDGIEVIYTYLESY